ncbi:MAG: hypothetical protein FJ399_24720 [Verrucomicrobia bacterium]|nr:hypothetical protein [Verrucomicrobiota bacterium]
MRQTPRVMARAWIGFVAAALTWGLLSPPAHARYMPPDLEEVSIGRLIANVARQAEAKPDDPDVWFRLARLHAMAYASKGDTAQVNRRP